MNVVTLRGEPSTSALGDSKQQLTQVPRLELPTDWPRPVLPGRGTVTQQFAWNEPLTAGLEQFAQQQQVSLLVVLLAGCQALLGRYAAQTEFWLASAAGGPQAHWLLHAKLGQDPPFAWLVQQTAESLRVAQARGPVCLARLAADLALDSDCGEAVFCPVQLSLAGVEPAVAAPRPVKPAAPVSWDLSLVFERVGDRLVVDLEYRPDLFLPARIQRLAGHLEVLLGGALANPGCRVSALPMLTAAEQQQLLVDWNDTTLEYDSTRTLPEQIEAVAAAQPSATALIHDQTQLSYGELNARANRMARGLQRRGVGPAVLVGVCLRRTLDLPVAMLAVLKAGGAYVPLDPAWPVERTRLILEDAGTALVITEPGLLEQIPERLDPTQLDGVAESAANLGPIARAADLAYIIYTSGSTGRPKGVALEHRNATALIAWARAWYRPADFAGMGFSTSVCFDMSVFELFVTLSLGGTAILAENALELAAIPAARELIFLDTVPSVAREMLRNGVMPAAVRTINLGGEFLPQDLVDQLYELPQVERVYDLYGPTETTTFSTCVLRRRGGQPSLGRPISNTRLYLLDEHRQPVPVGVPGELYIGGDGVARGYLHQPQLTAERFLPDPFAGRPGRRLYRTGDRMRYGADGTLEFLGRLDHQVKFHGFRIEPGEIEARLRQFPGVRDAVVLVETGGGGDRHLVGYLLAPHCAGLACEQVREHLQQLLPAYMVPARLVCLKQFPLTPSGKVDRRALAVTPRLSALPLVQPILPPQTPVERALVAIWAGVLQRPSLGVTDDFFGLGGHSLLAVQVLARVQEQFGVHLPMRCLFEHPTVQDLAVYIEAMRWAQQTTRPAQDKTVEGEL